jgi:pyruvate dehydrogenase E2 component (dihydrolipoamide acetyltransferase)
MTIKEVQVPDIGDFASVDVTEILVKPGDAVKPEQSLITVESDKASMEIPSPAAGVVKELRVKVGDKVSEGSLVLLMELDADGATAAPAVPAPAQSATVAATVATVAAAPVAAVPVAAAPVTTAPIAPPSPVVAAAASAPVAEAVTGAASGSLPHASPSVRKFARELGVDLRQLQGSGPKGRIQQSDVQAYVKAVIAQGGTATAAVGAGAGGSLNLLPWPKVDFAKFGPIESKPLSRIKKLSGANLARNWVVIPHVTNNDEADITDLEAFRVALNQEQAKSGLKITMLAFLIKACVAALKKYPEMNSSLEGDNLVLKQYWHIGFAADTPNGLVVPVIRDADRKGVLELARETGALAAKAREGKLSPAEMQGGTFSISSLGGIGGTSFTPIINAPEVAILGVSRSAMKPVWNEDTQSFEPRLMLPLSLSYDHRVIDGAAGARFNAYLAQVLADFRRVLL